MSNNYKKRVKGAVCNTQNIKHEKMFKDKKAQKTKTVLAYILAMFMFMWTVCSVFGVIGFIRSGRKDNTIVASAESVEDNDNYDNTFPNTFLTNNVGDYANYLSFPYSFLPDSFEDDEFYTYNGLSYKVNKGGTVTLNGAVNTQFELRLSSTLSGNASLMPNKYYYFYTGNAVKLLPQNCIIAYYDSQNRIQYKNMNSPLLWSSSFRFSHVFYRTQVGDYFNNEQFYFSLLRFDTVADFNAIDINGAEKYYNAPLNYAYYYGYVDGNDDGYENGFYDGIKRIESSFYFNAGVYIRPSQLIGERGFDKYEPTYIKGGIDIASAVNSAVAVYQNTVPDFNNSIQVVISLYYPLNADLFYDCTAFSFVPSNVGVAGFWRTYNGTFAENSIFDLPSRNMLYSSIFPTAPISNIDEEDIVSYFSIQGVYGETKTNFNIIDRKAGEGSTVYYDLGYGAGYKKGLQESTNNNTMYNEGYKNGYSIGFDKGLQASDSGLSFKSLFTSLLDVPVKVFTSLFDFNVLGVNLTQFFLSLLSVCFVLVVIKLLI